MYYIWSVSHTKGDITLWWMPDDRGYTRNLALAGKHTEREIIAQRRYYDNGETTRAVPVEVADAMAMRVVLNDGHELQAKIEAWAATYADEAGEPS